MGLPVLEYKGYLGLLRINHNNRDRIYGSVAHKSDPSVILRKDSFAGDNLEEMQQRLKWQVENILSNIEYSNKQELWRKNTDIESISIVYNILPKLFKERVLSGKFDKDLLKSVPGGDYTVPLYYVTKAWDFILGSQLSSNDYMIGPYTWNDPKPGISDWREFVIDKHPQRFRCQAYAHNIQMKQLWLELFNIDIDALEVDFSRFNMHMTPYATEDEEWFYFTDVPNGVCEWILEPVNLPHIDFIFHDCVSNLMEYTAYRIRDIQNGEIY